MEQDKNPSTRSDLDPGIGVAEILSNLEFIFICHGIILSIVVIIGVILNLLCVCVLFHKRFRSSPPYCLLQALTLGDLAILFLSVYSDIHPAIASHRTVQGLLLPEEKLLQKLDSILNKPNESLNITRGLNKSQQTLKYTDEELELFLKTLVGPGIEFQLTKLPEKSLDNGSVLYNFDRISVNTRSYFPTTTEIFSLETTSSVNNATLEINTEPLRNAVERFVAYFLMTYNLLIITTLAVERCFVVVRPLKAKIVITVYRTRCVIFVISFACFVIHCPQLVREVVLILTEPSRVRDDFRGTLLQSFRHCYETILMYLTSFLLVTVIVVNIVLITVVVRQRKRVCQTLQQIAESAEKKHNSNVAYVILFLTCCQLPPVIAGNVIAHLSMTSFKQHVTIFIKTFVLIRCLYVSNSALNCLVYCLIARRFRRAFVDIYFRCCRKNTRGKKTGLGFTSSPEVSSKSRVVTQASPSTSLSEKLHGSLTLLSHPEITLYVDAEKS